MIDHRKHKLPTPNRRLQDLESGDADLFRSMGREIELGAIREWFGSDEMTAVSNSTTTVGANAQDILSAMTKLKGTIESPLHVGDIKFRESLFMTKTEEYKRSWRERLWSWPWRPWRSHAYREIPSDEVYMMDLPFTGTRVVVGHPETLKEVRRQFENLNKEQL